MKAITSHTDFPDFFRRSTLDYLLNTLNTGSNIQLIGLIGSGKSVLLRNLPPDTNFKFVYVDLNFIPEKTSASIIDYIKSHFSPTPNTQTVVIFDHFETVADPKLAPLFDWLFAHYQTFRGQLSYIFASTDPLITHQKLSLFHKLAPLLTQNIYYLPPLNKQESLWFMEECLSHLGKELTSAKKDKILALTGGYMQTIKRLIEAQSDYKTDIHLNYHLECLYQNLLPYLNSPELLTQMHITNSSGQFTNQLLSQLITSKQNSTNPDLSEILTGSELKIFTCLLNHSNQIVSRNDLIATVWGINSVNISDHALDQLILRLKKKLVTNSQYQIETLRGRGHRLTQLAEISV